MFIRIPMECISSKSNFERSQRYLSLLITPFQQFMTHVEKFKDTVINLLEINRVYSVI